MNKYKTALITGASSGIGKAFATELAKQNIDLILIARREELLNQIKNFLTDYNISVTVYPLDLVENTEKYCEIISQHKPDILINSAGFGRPGLFSNLDIKNHNEMLEVHINSVVKSNYEALKYMLPNEKGLIINVSSLAGLLYGKGYTMYGSTKHFIKDFSQRLSYETLCHKVYVQGLCPGFTYTGFHDTEYYPHFNRNKYPKFLWQSAEEVAKESLKNYKKNVYVPGRINKIIYFLSQSFITKSLVGKFMKSSKS